MFVIVTVPCSVKVMVPPSKYVHVPMRSLNIWLFVGVFSSQGSNRNAAARAFTFASFLCSILAIPLVVTGFLAVKFMYLCFIFVAVGALWIKLSSPAGD